MIAFRRLSHSYPSGRTVFTELSASIAPGERVALVGPNGSGKSTLLARLAGLLPGVAGCITIAGCDPALASQRAELVQRVGVLFQNPDDQLFCPTVLEDVAFGPIQHGISAADATALAHGMLAQLNLTHLAAVSPHLLSGGEKRAVALAGVLISKPRVLLLDEPTQYLDAPGRRELTVWLQAFPGKLLIASHELDWLYGLCPRSLILNGGAIRTDGLTAELYRDQALLEANGLELPYRFVGAG